MFVDDNFGLRFVVGRRHGSGSEDLLLKEKWIMSCWWRGVKTKLWRIAVQNEKEWGEILGFMFSTVRQQGLLEGDQNLSSWSHQYWIRSA